MTQRHTLDSYYSDLIETAATAAAKAGQLGDGETKRARAMLDVLESRLRSVAGIFDRDPSSR